LKKIAQTDAIFDNVTQENQRADADPKVLRLSIDTKAKVKIGNLSRNEKDRSLEARKADDHDTEWQSVLVPFGILNLNNDELSIYFVLNVNQSRRFSPWARAFYQQQKQAGKSHQTAIRALAYKWGRILWRCWQDNTPYDEQKYLAALARKKSPLIKLLGSQNKDSQTFADA
jgi:hypothetical protein